MNRPGFAPAVLLDTCALIWLASRAPIAPDALEAILHAAGRDGVHVSPVSAWEIGMLNRRTPFRPDPATWFSTFMAGPGLLPAPFTADIAIAASELPEPLHRDPADRLLIATARRLGLPLVTRDERILAYGRAGHVAVIPC